MACITATGGLTQSGKDLLNALDEPMAPPAIAARVGNPLFKVRASLRQMEEAGLVLKMDDGYVATSKGKEAADST